MTQRPSFLAPISDATLRCILMDARDRRDVVAVRLIEDELFYRQPIVTNDTGYGHWTATRGDYDLDCTVGYGRTEQEAADDLVEREDDERADDEAKYEPVDYGMSDERERHP